MRHILGFLALITLASAFAPSSRTTPLGITSSFSKAATRSSLSTPFVRQQQYHEQNNNAAAALTMSSEAAKAPESSSSGGGGEGTLSAMIFNLVKGVVGAGVLGLPAGVVAFGNAPSAALPALIMITVIGALSGYGFALIGRVCAFTGTKTFREAWSASVSKETSWIPAVTVTFKTYCAILAYSMILGDTFSSLFTSAGLSVSSSTSLLGVTGLVLLPLCLLKNLSSLAPFSLLGSVGMIYTAIAMAIRYFSGAYAKGGKFAKATAPHLAPSFGTAGAEAALSPNAAVLVAMLSTAYMAHFNAPKFYVELKDNTIPRFLKVVSTSFAMAIAIFASMTCLGFLTFGGACSGVILNNYATSDTLMSIARCAVAVSLVGSYPLAFVGARDGTLDLFKVKDRSNKTLNALTGALLAGITVAALIIPDVSFVFSFAGATLGNALIYVFPALMFRGAVKRMDNATGAQKRETKFAMAVAALGIGMGALGAKMAIASLK